MIEKLKSLFQKYLSGERDKAGFSALEIELSYMHARAEFDLAELNRDVHLLATEIEPTTVGFWSPMRMIIENFGLKSQNLADIIENNIFADGIDAEDQYDAAICFMACDGSFSPQQLNSLTVLKSQLPALWLDLAIVVFESDFEGLRESISDLLADVNTDFSWKNLKSRYRKLIVAVGVSKFNSLILEISSSIENYEERQKFLEWIDRKRHTRLSHIGDRTKETRETSDEIKFGQRLSDFIAIVPQRADPITAARS